jgi:hypothetical protein
MTILVANNFRLSELLKKLQNTCKITTIKSFSGKEITILRHKTLKFSIFHIQNRIKIRNQIPLGINLIIIVLTVIFTFSVNYYSNFNILLPFAFSVIMILLYAGYLLYANISTKNFIRKVLNTAI